jgi:hypothetical protein
MSLKKPECPFCHEEMLLTKQRNNQYVLFCGNLECKMIVRTKAHYKTMAGLFADLGKKKLAEQFSVADER